MDWDPDQYLAFETARLQPALDLLARIDLAAPRHVVDLGCGPGHITARLAARWPDARVTGADRSPDMLARARAAWPELAWHEADIATWTPAEPPDLIFANAALQWLPDHETLLPRLQACLAPGGTLAVQMPDNFEAPWNDLIRELAESGRWDFARPAYNFRRSVRDPATYHDLLAPQAARLDIWQTRYLHVLSGDNPVVEWTKGTALRPVLAELPADRRPEFEAAYGARIAEAYPRRADGKTLFPFRRLFLLAKAR